MGTVLTPPGHTGSVCVLRYHGIPVVEPSRYPPLSKLNLRSLNQTIARLDHYFQARIRNRFGRTVRALSRFIPIGGVVFDVGANHGKFTKNFARVAGGTCRIYAFEPLEYNYTLLEKIVRPYANVTVLRVALSDAEGEASLYVPVKDSRRLSPGSAHLGDESAGTPDFGTGTARDVYRQTIATDTIDNVMKRESLERLDFMKIDVQGAECLVLRGGMTALQTHKPGIYCELSAGLTGYLGMSVNDTIDLLRGLGYTMHVLDATTGRVDAATFDPRVNDYLFLHPEGPTADADARRR